MIGDQPQAIQYVYVFWHLPPVGGEGGGGRGEGGGEGGGGGEGEGGGGGEGGRRGGEGGVGVAVVGCRLCVVHNYLTFAPTSAAHPSRSFIRLSISGTNFV